MATGTSPRTPGALPAQLSCFVGRQAELARVAELLGRSRLVTITGAGGVGKTRLAVHAADAAAAGFADGVCFAELSEVRDPAMVEAALAAALTAAAGTDPAAAAGDGPAPPGPLLGRVRGRELLLVIDTCEHLIDECAALADTILRGAPGVTILATSRQPLDAAGEATLVLGPLPVPDPASASGPAGAGDAAELFAQRAAAVVPGFTLTLDNLADVLTVCSRLDGVPLAIELAAVRLRALPLRQMAARIDDRLRLLTGGRRSGPRRHQTLRASITWSHSLCTPAEQLLWARLSVFAGGFDLAAAEAVCAGAGLAAPQVVPAIISLVDKNVLSRCAEPGTAGGGAPAGGGTPAGLRFRMLGTLREFGAERLRDTRGPDATASPGATFPGGLPELPGPAAARSVVPAAAASSTTGAPGRAGPRGAEAAVRRRLIAYYLALAESFERAPAAEVPGWCRRLADEHPNLRAAFDGALSLPGNDGAAVVMATSLFAYWRISGRLREAEYWLDRALDRCPERSAAGARVLATRGYIRVLLGDLDGGGGDARAAIALAGTFGDMAAGGRAYSALHRALGFGGSLIEAQDAARSAARCLEADGDTAALAQLDAADALLQLQAGLPGRCCESAARGLARLPAQDACCAGHLQGLLALGRFLQGDIDRAKAPALRALELQHQSGDVIGMAFGLGTVAFIAAGEAQYARAAWFLGASAPLWELAGRWYTGAPALESLHQVTERVARASLGDDQFWRLHAAGGATPRDEAIRRALSDIDVT